VRKEPRTLYTKAVDSLILAVDHFNRVWDRGRTEAVRAGQRLTLFPTKYIDARK